MASPPPNPDTRLLPPGWIQQYNFEYRQWFYVNTRENPPRSSWEHPAGLIPQGFAPPPPDRSYNRSPYGGPPPPPQGYGGYSGYAQRPPQGYYNNAPQGGYYENRGYPQERVYVEEERREQKKGIGLGTVALAGGAGLLGGALLTEAIESHDEYERQEGFDQGLQEGYGAGYDNGFDNGYDNGYDNGFDNGFVDGF